MIHIVDIKNPFNLLDGHTYHKLESASSVWDMLEQIGWTSIEYGITVTVGNTHLEEDQWDLPIPDGAHVGIAPKVEGGLSFAIFVIIAIVSVVVALTYTIQPPTSPSTSEADPVFSLRGQTNQTKLNGLIESAYGDVRHWPSNGADSYTKYINQDAWQFTLLCLGHGEYDLSDLTPGELLERVFIEDTPVKDFSDVNLELVRPYEEVTLFRDNVETNTEVGTIELYGPNEADYVQPDGWFTATANSAGTVTDLIEFDVTFPRGLYVQDKKGRLRNYTVTLEFQILEIDDNGDPIGVWTTLRNITKTKHTVTPLRYSYGENVTPGRYQVRGRRTNSASASSKVGDSVVWESLRAYLPNVGFYGNVTMLAISARATANLNNQSKRQFNFRGTRKLPIWDGASWSELTATRNPIWAFCDIFRSAYGPALADKYLHLASLKSVADQLETEEKWFDWVYDTKQTVWAAAVTCAASFRAIPLMDVARLYVQEDRPKTVVQHLFNNENIIEGSFSLDTSLPRTEDLDGITVEYTDHTTWKVETVPCLLPGSQGLNMETITVAGITNRDRAYREGMYQLLVKLKQRQQVTIRTGMEGFIATHSDLSKIEFDTFGVDGTYGGSILFVSQDRLTVQLNQEVELPDGDEVFTVRGKDGTPFGPYGVTAGPSSDTVVLDSPLTEEIAFGNTIINPLFILGKPTAFAKNCSVTELRPSNDGTVEVVAMVYVPEVYDYDNATAPPLEGSGSLIPQEALPVVTGVDLSLVAGDTYAVTWNTPVRTTTSYYVIQTSPEDDTLDIEDPAREWQDAGTSVGPSFEIILLTEYLHVRVAGINTGQGPWAYYSQFLEGTARVTPSGAYRITPDGKKRVIKTI
tara:strand:- start:115 stop:2700 length:2586 start_codon:yes stop_codon:yes gene_type:complete